MTNDQEDLLRMAKESLAAARLLFDQGYPGFAVSRAYYSMFYVVQAFLENEGLSFSKHSAVIAAFSRHFTRPGHIPTEYHRFLLDAFEARHVGDYAPRKRISPETAQIHIEHAEKFIDLAEKMIGIIPE